MLTYAIVPFVIMLVCSIIIIIKVYSTRNEQIYALSKKNATIMHSSHHHHHHHQYQHQISKQTQITSILLTTNFLFFALVSPLLLMNAMNMLQENTLSTTIAYFLSYSNHGYGHTHFFLHTTFDYVIVYVCYCFNLLEYQGKHLAFSSIK